MKIVKRIYNFFKKHKIPIIVITILLILIRIFIICYSFKYKYITYDKSKQISVMVIRLDKVQDGKVSYIVKLEKGNENNTFLNKLNVFKKYSDNFVLNIYDYNYYSKTTDENTNYDITQHINENINYEYGDILKLNGKILIPEKLNNPYEFDYKKYLNANNIYGTISTYKVEKVNEILGNIVLNFAYSLRKNIGEKIYEKLPYEEAELFKSMVYGDDSKLSESIKKDFEITGVSHLIAVSGSNVSAVLIVIYYICNSLRLSTKKRIGITVIFLVMFCIIASLELSIIRASIMAFAFVIAEAMNKKISKYKSCIIAFLIIIIYNPYSIFNVGFELSFMATFSIILIYNHIFTYIDTRYKKTFKIHLLYIEKNKYIKLLKKINYVIFSYINILFSVTISSQILTLPIQIYYFNSFSISSIISNIIVVSVANIQRITGFAAFFLINVPYISDILVNSNYIILKTIIFCTSYIANLNMPIIHLPRPNIIILLCYYLIVFMIYKMNKLNKKLSSYNLVYTFKKILNKKIVLTKNKLKIIYRTGILISTLVIILLYVYYIYVQDYIYYFNVKQGNMAFIHCNGVNIVVDMGSETENLADGILDTFLKASGITKIDAVFFTHMHTDHINAYPEIFENYEVDSVYLADNIARDEEDENTKNSIILKTREKNISVKILQEDDYISLKDNINVYILSPPKNSYIYASDIENANSMVMLFSIKKSNFLFMGDSTKETEYYIVRKIKQIEESINSNLDTNNTYTNINKAITKNNFKNIDVLQVGHHGSKTSTSEYFVKSLNFKEAVISAQKKTYGHPSDVTIDVLNKYNITIRITEKEGAIRYSIK